MPYCVNCGNEVKENDRFCSSCGFKVNGEKEEPKKVMKCFTVFGNVGHALGIVTLVLAFIPFINLYAFIFGIHGIVFSALGKKDESQIAKCNSGLKKSIIGSILGTILFIVFIIVIIILSE